MATFISIGIYKGSWNCSKRYLYTIVIRTQEPGKLYNLFTDQGRVFDAREIHASRAGPLQLWTHLGTFLSFPSSYKPKPIDEYVQNLPISHGDSFDWVVKVVTQMASSNVINATLEEHEFELQLRNITRQLSGSEVSHHHVSANDLLLDSADSMHVRTDQRNVRPMRGGKAHSGS
jgi:hypothetical protein